MIPSELSLNWLRNNIPFNDEHYEGAYALCEAALKLDKFIEEAVNIER